MNPAAKSILIIDDDRDVQSILRNSLESAGYKISVAENGAEAAASLKQSKPDLIILDIFLPDTDGYELCASLRKAPATSATPILLLSGMGEVEPELRGQDCGASGYIAKPFEVAQLLDRIQKLLPA